MFLVVPVGMAVVGFFIFKAVLGNLADEVFDNGDSLLIKHRDQEVVVPLATIMNVSPTTMMNPPRITLRLINPIAGIGDEISFSPAHGLFFNPFTRNELAEELILHVHRAKSGESATR